MKLCRYLRLLPSRYGDDKASPTRSTKGKQLLGAREISLNAFGASNATESDPRLTLINMQWGQLVAHDMGLTDGVKKCGMYT